MFHETFLYDELWVIGGSQIYKQFLELNLINNFYVTMIDDEYTCDDKTCVFHSLVCDGNNDCSEVDEHHATQIANQLDHLIKSGHTKKYEKTYEHILKGLKQSELKLKKLFELLKNHSIKSSLIIKRLIVFSFL